MQAYLRSLRIYGRTPTTLYSVRIVSHDSTTPTPTTVIGPAVQITMPAAVAQAAPTATAVDCRTIQLTWAGTGGGTPLKYDVEWRQGPGGTGWALLTVALATPTLAVPACIAPFPYSFRVTAYTDQRTAASAETATSDSVTVSTPPAVVPVVGVVTRTSVALSWAPATVGPGPYTYDVDQCIYDGVYPNGAARAQVTTIAAGLTALGTTVTGLAPGTTYVFYVIARDAAGAVISGIFALATTLP